MHKKDDQPGRKELRQFGLVTGAIAAVLFGLLLPWLFDHRVPLWPWIVAALLWIAALAVPARLLIVYRGWMAVGHALGWINTRIILGVMFYCLFLPVGLLMRLSGKDPMERRLDRSRETYRVNRETPGKDHVERPY